MSFADRVAADDLGLNAGYLAAVSVTSWVGLTYPIWTRGLAAEGSATPFYCEELLSSGSDDTAMITVFSLFAVSLAYRITAALLGRGPGLVEAAVFWLVCIMALFGLMLASMDCAQVMYTAFGIPDIQLASGLVAWGTSIICFVCLRHGQTNGSAVGED